MQLASLALPPHPFVLARIEDAPPMQQEKAAAAGARPITLVQLSDRLGGHSEQMCIAFQNLLVSVDPVRQESEGEVAASAGKVVNLQPLNLLQKEVAASAGQEVNL